MAIILTHHFECLIVNRVLSQGWSYQHLKICGWMFGMGRQLHTGAIPQMPRQASVTMLKWQSTSLVALRWFPILFYLLPS